MPKVIVDISTSLDGFVAGPNPTLDEPLGQHGEDLHEWAFAAASWRESHGQSGGEDNADSKVIEESVARTGAFVMGRRMFRAPSSSQLRTRTTTTRPPTSRRLPALRSMRCRTRW